MQEEVASGIPYQHAMSAEELLQELLCQRFEQDFQLLKYVNMSEQLSLHKEQTYYLSHGQQVHKIVFMHEGQLALPRTPAMATANAATHRTSGVVTAKSRSNADRASRYSKDVAISSGGAQLRWQGGEWPSARDSLSFSKVQVTRYLLHQSHHLHKRTGLEARARAVIGVGAGSLDPQDMHYHYYVCGPHGVGYQRATTQIRATQPHVFPWNRLDSIVCGWDNFIDLDIRLRCRARAFEFASCAQSPPAHSRTSTPAYDVDDS